MDVSISAMWNDSVGIRRRKTSNRSKRNALTWREYADVAEYDDQKNAEKAIKLIETACRAVFAFISVLSIARLLFYDVLSGIFLLYMNYKEGKIPYLVGYNRGEVDQGLVTDRMSLHYGTLIWETVLGKVKQGKRGLAFWREPAIFLEINGKECPITDIRLQDGRSGIFDANGTIDAGSISRVELLFTPGLFEQNNPLFEVAGIKGKAFPAGKHQVQALYQKDITDRQVIHSKRKRRQREEVVVFSFSIYVPRNFTYQQIKALGELFGIALEGEIT